MRWFATFWCLIYVSTPFLSEVRNFPALEMGVAQKTTFSNPNSLKIFFGVSGDLMEYNERGKPLKRLSSLTNPKSAGLIRNERFSAQTQQHLKAQCIIYKYIIYVRRKNVRQPQHRFAVFLYFD